MNRAIRRLSLACLIMFVALMLMINYLQAFRGGRLAADPGNIRVFDQQLQYQRGPIIAAGGPGKQMMIAESRLVKGSNDYQRFYPAGREFSAVTGYDSLFSATGIEGAEDKLLAGTSPSLTVHNLISLLTGKSQVGASVFLTVNPKAQLAAYQALAAEGRPAGAVAINPRTGAILAMASYPTFNPNSYATLDSAKLAKIDAAYRHDRSQPLLNRAINDTFPPGSTFKIVTSSTAFGTGAVANTNTPIPAPQFYPLPGSSAVLHNDNDELCGNGNPPIIYAFTLSCNTAFAKLGVKLGATSLHNQANLFGFNNFGHPNGPPLTVPMAVTPSSYPLLSDPAQTGLSAIGQFNDTVTPLQEAMLAATVANGGTLMKPYLVQQVVGPDLSTIAQAQSTVLAHPISSQVASNLAAMMESVTQNPAGTAYGAVGPTVTSINIAGKTGTAQNGINNSNLDDAVFTCYAPASNPQIAVGVIVQGGGFGASAAAPIALAIIRAYLGITH